MSQTETHTVTTAHGETTYETVECDSCGTDTAKDEARSYIMGTCQSKQKWRIDGGYIEYHISRDDVQEGYVCPYCYDSGPIDTPSKKLKNMTANEPFLVALAFGFIAGLVVGMIVI